MINQIRRDERGATALQWIGIISAVITLIVFIPQVRSGIDVLYETLVGKNNVAADGSAQPGVLVRGIIVGVGSLVVFVGSVMLIAYTNLGRRLSFLVTGAAFFGFMAILGLFYTMFAPRGLRPTSLEGLNAFQLKILPIGLMLASAILFAMFLAALSRYEAELGDE